MTSKIDHCDVIQLGKNSKNKMKQSLYKKRTFKALLGHGENRLGAHCTDR